MTNKAQPIHIKNHEAAFDETRIQSRIGVRMSHESALVAMTKALEDYAFAYSVTYESQIGDDGVLGQHWTAIGEGILGLLNGESGRIDCGMLDRRIREELKSRGVKVEL